MPNIDERVVQMTFDNKQFESGVSESLKTLDDLKKALNFDEVEGSLKRIENAFNNLDLSGLADSVDFIASRFEPLGKIADVALSRIADKAIDVGKKITDAFFGFSDMSAGQSKYETRTKAVQTIMNATGKSIEEVEAVLDKLQDYTDETSYDFAAMVDNIGKFTSVGVDLELAEKAMEGIGNEAAKSGASIQQANHAMYNFAQALSQGSVKLQDWRSIANATMATKEFKEMLISTAIEMGTLKSAGENIGSVVSTNEKQLAAGQKALAKAQKATKDRAEKVAEAQAKIAAATKETEVNFQTFENTLSDGWLTSDVLIKTLNKYSNMETDFGREAYYAAQKALTFTDAIQAVKDAVSSGWMDSFGYIFGNLEEAMKLWTDVSNALYEYIAIFADWRNEILKSWHEMGGYNDMIEAAANLWQTFMNIVKGVGKALTNVFPVLMPEKMTQVLYDGTKALKEWSADLLEMFGLQEDVKKEEEEAADEAAEVADKVDEVKESTDAAADSMTDLSDASKDVAKSVNGIETGIKRGMRGDNVKALQQKLVSLGFRLDKFGVDGIFGPETQAAVEELQRALGVEVTGALDEATLAALNTEEGMAKLQERMHKGLSSGDVGKDVRDIQNELNKYLGDNDKIVADGIYGPKTKAAVEKLQKELGIEVTGVWDDTTRAAFESSKMILFSFDKIRKGIKRGDVSEAVKALQEQLIKTGYLTDQSVADGIYGPKTEEAVRKLQRELGVKETGVWDEATYHAAVRAKRMEKANLDTAESVEEAAKTIDEASEKAEEASESADKATSRTTVAMMRLQNIVKGWAAALKIAGKFIGAITEIGGNILAMFKPLMDVAYRFGSVFGIMFQNLAEELDKNDVYGSFVKKVTGAFGPFGSLLKTIADALNGFLDSYDAFLELSGKKNTFGSFFDFLGSWVSSIPIFGIVSDAFNNVLEVIGSVVSALGKWFGDLTGWFSFDTFEQGKKNVFDWIITKSNSIKDAFNSVMAWLGVKIEIFKSWFSSNTLNGKSNVFAWIVTQANKIKDAFNSVMAWLGVKIEIFKSWFSSNTLNGKSNVFAWIVTQANKIKDAFNSVMAWLGVKIEIFKSWFSSNTLNGKSNVFTWIVTQANKIKDAFNSVMAWLGGKIEIFKSWFSSNTLNGKSNVFTWIVTQANKIKDAFNSVMAWFGVKIEIFKSWFSSNTLNGKSNVFSWIVTQANKIKDAFNSVMAWFGQKDDLKQNDTPIGRINSIINDSFDSKKASSVQKGMQKSLTILGRISKVFRKVKAVFSEIVRSLSMLLFGNKDNHILLTKGEKAALDFRNGIINVFKNIADTVSKIGPFISVLLTGTGGDGILDQSTIDGIMNFRATIIGIFEKIANAFSNIVSGIKNFFSGFSLDGVKRVFENVLKGLENVFKFIWEKALALLKWGLVAYALYKVFNIIDNITDVFGRIKDLFTKTDKNTSSLSTTMLKFAGAIAIIAGSIGLISIIKPDRLLPAVLVVEGIMAVMVGLVYLTKKYINNETAKNFKKLGSTMLGIGISIAIFAATIGLIGNELGRVETDAEGNKRYVGLENFGRGILGLVGIMTILGVFIVALNKLKATDLNIKGSGLWQLSIIIATLAGVVLIIANSQITFEDAAKGVAVAIGLLAGIGVMMRIMGKVSKTTLKIKGFLGLAVVIGVLAHVAKTIGTLNGDDYFKTLGAIVALFGPMIGLVALFAKYSEEMKIAPMIVFFLGIASAIAAFGIVLTKIKDVDPLVMVAFSGSLALALAAFSIACVQIGKGGFGKGGNARSMLTGAGALAGSLAIVAAAITVIIGGLGKLDQIPAFEGAFERGGQLLLSLAEALKSFKENGLMELGVVIGILVALANIEGLLQSSGVSMTLGALGLSAALIVIVVALAIIVGGLGYLDEQWNGGLSKAIEAGGNVLASISGAIKKFIDGFKDDLTEDIGAFSEAIGSLVTTIDGYSKDQDLDADIEKVFEIANKMKGFFESIGSYNVNLSGIEGYNTAAEALSTDIGTFGEKIGIFRTGVADLDADNTIVADTDKAIEIAKHVKEKFFDVIGGDEYLPDGTGLETYNTRLDTIIDHLGTFGTNMGIYHDNVSGFNTPTIESDTTAAITAATQVARFMEEVGGLNIETKLGGILGWFQGETKQESVSGYVVKLAESITQSKDSFKNLNTSGIVQNTTAAIAAFKEIAKFLTFLSSENVVVHSEITTNSTGWGEGLIADKLNTFLTHFVNIADKIKEFSNKTEGVDLAGTASVVQAVVSFMEFASTGLSQALANVDAISGDSEIGAKLGEIISNMAVELEPHKEDFKTAGMNFDLGLAEGISEYAENPVTAIGNVAQSMIDKVNAVLDEHSPSQEAFMQGVNYVLGLVLGTKDTSDEAEKASGDVASSMLHGFSELIAKKAEDIPIISSLIDTDAIEKGLNYATDAIDEKFGVGTKLADLFGNFNIAAEDINSISDALANVLSGDYSIESIFNSEDAETAINNIMSSFENGLEGIPDLKELLNEEGVENDINQLFSTMASYGDDFKKNYSLDQLIGEELNIGDTGNVVKQMQEILMGLGYNFDKFGADGIFGPETQAAVNAFKKDIGLAMDGTFDSQAYLKIAEALTGTQATASYTEAGNKILSLISEGFESGDISSVDKLTTNLLSSLQKKTGDFKTAGENFIKGLTNGVYFQTRFAVEAAAYVARQMVRAVRDTFQTASPSKVTTQIGRYFSEGLGNGVNEEGEHAINSSRNVANSMLQTARETLMPLSTSLFEDVDDNPVIRPVVDMSNVEAARNSLPGYFRGQSGNLSVSARLARNVSGEFERQRDNGRIGYRSIEMRSSSSSERYDASNNSNNNDLLDSFNRKFDRLASAIGNMQVVLDSGELVGATSNQYDRQFGRMAGRKGRGN